MLIMSTQQIHVVFDWSLAHPSGPDARVTCSHWPDARPGRKKSIARQAFFRPGRASGPDVRVTGAHGPFHTRTHGPGARAVRPGRAPG